MARCALTVSLTRVIEPYVFVRTAENLPTKKVRWAT